MKSVFVDEELLKAAQFRFYEAQRTFPPGVACAPAIIAQSAQVIFLAFDTIVWHVNGATGELSADVGRFHLEVDRASSGWRSLALPEGGDWVIIAKAATKSECVIKAAKWLQENINEVDYRVVGVGTVRRAPSFAGELAAAACPACQGTGWRFPGRECTDPSHE